MKQNARPLERVREVVNAARGQCSRPDSAPAITHSLLNGPLWEEIETDAEGIKALAMMGLNALVRGILKKHGDGDEDAGPLRSRQLNLFPEKLHPILREIDRDRVFVPSRDEFIELTPDTISIIETREAGEFLVSKGQECIRRGNRLIELAAAMEAV